MRGALAFRVGGIDKVTYIHDGAEFSKAGELIVEWCREADWKAAKKLALKMKKVTGEPSDEQLLEFCINMGIDLPSAGSYDWYSLLRPFQAKPGGILQAKFYLAYPDFMKNSLKCEYAYVINFDMMDLEVYKGRQTIRHFKGRYASHKTYALGRGNVEYYPVALVGKFDLFKIPEGWQACLNGRR